MPARPQTPRAFLLELLGAAPDGLPVSALLRAGEVMGLTANNVRVALARAKQQGLVSAGERGWYRLGPEALAVHREVSRWRRVEDALGPWRGWVVVHAGALPKSERVAARRQERALRLLGFRELSPGLHVRPDNLVGGADDVRRRLLGLGLDGRALVFRVDGFDDATEKRARRLWDVRALQRDYARLTTALQKASVRSGSAEARAREAFSLGGAAIRAIAADPLLPAPIVDEQARAAFFREMRRFDDRSRPLWAGLLGAALHPPAPPESR